MVSWDSPHTTGQDPWTVAGTISNDRLEQHESDDTETENKRGFQICLCATANRIVFYTSTLYTGY
jgi:hypothetical protein